MDTNIWVTLISVVLAFLGGGGGKWIVDFIKEKSSTSLQQQKQSSEIKLTEVEKAFSIYKDIVESVKHDMIELTKSMQVLEKEYIITRERNAELNARGEMKDAQIADLKTQLAQIKK